MFYEVIILSTDLSIFTNEETQCPGSQGNSNTGNTNSFGM